MPIANAQPSIFEEGRNCRRVADAGRVAFIVDGDDYFKTFMAAAERARELIIVVAWDFNSNCCLSVECDSKDPRAKLGEYLNYLARRRRGLHIYVLDWDFPMIYAKDREAPVRVRLGWGWKPHRRVHLEFDNTHPPGGSHHQKIVVIDDAIAFCGGLDLTCQRWDTPAHAAVRSAPGRGGPALSAVSRSDDRGRWRSGAGARSYSTRALARVDRKGDTSRPVLTRTPGRLISSRRLPTCRLRSPSPRRSRRHTRERARSKRSTST